jgi:hypothetical protein
VFGRDWDSAEAVIVARHVKKTAGSTTVFEFIADVTPATGEPFRVTIQEPGIATNFWPPSAGDRVTVLVDRDRDSVRPESVRPESVRRVKFDKDDQRISAKWRMADQQRSFEAVGEEPAGTDPFGMARPSRDVIRATIQAAVDAAAMQSGSPGQETVLDPAARLARLDSLRKSGLVTDDEYATARARIIAEI